MPGLKHWVLAAGQSQPVLPQLQGSCFSKCFTLWPKVIHCFLHHSTGPSYSFQRFDVLQSSSLCISLILRKDFLMYPAFYILQWNNIWDLWDPLKKIVSFCCMYGSEQIGCSTSVWFWSCRRIYSLGKLLCKSVELLKFPLTAWLNSFWSLSLERYFTYYLSKLSVISLRNTIGAYIGRRWL